jgi:RND family efflux transporter MFP subunit
MNRSFMIRSTLAVAAGALVALWGCGRNTSRDGERADAAPVAVTALRVGGSAEAGELVLPGRVKAAEEVTLTARMPARLTQLPLREGQAFRAGAVLARFEAEEARRALEAARSGLSAATMRRDQARLQESRMDSLYAARVAALRELEGAQMERRAADAAYEQARAGMEELTSATTLTAPFAGVVVRRRVDPGAVMGPGQPVLDIRSAAPGDIEVAIPEAQVGRAQAGRAWLQVGDGPWRPARVLRLDGMIDYASRTRTAHVRPAGGAMPEPGASARVKFELPAARIGATGGGRTAVRPSDDSAPATPRIPSSSLVRRGELTGVYVLREGRAELRWLRIGRQAGGEVEVLAGLWEGEEIAASPAGLTDGRPVKVSR